MGLFDSHKRKSVGYRRTRNMEMKFLYECPRCSKEKAIHFEIPLVEDEHNIYAQWVGQSSSPYLKKLPIVIMSVDERGNYSVEDFFENLGGGKSAPILGERLKEKGLVIDCPYCGEKAHFVLGVAIIRKEGGIILQMQKGEEASSLPIVLLSDDGRGNFNVTTFLNPVSEPNGATERAELELNENQAESTLVDEDESVQERAAVMITESNTAIQSNPDDVEAYYKRAVDMC
mgnify:CR=1 FL=1